ncbi:MAG: peptidylprolyl isomerase [Bdellovibrionia bacterium]
MSKLVRMLGPAVAGLFILSGCNLDQQKLMNKPVLVVNEHSLTTKDFANKLAKRLKNFDSLAAKDPQNVARTKEEILKEFMIRSFIEDFAVTKKITVSDSEWDLEVNRLRANFPEDLTFRRALADENITFSEWRNDIKFNLLQKKVFTEIAADSKPITDLEIKNHYNENKEKFYRKERVFLSQIVVDDEAKIEALKLGLKTSSFKDYAAKYSITADSKTGGVVGWVEKGAVDYFDPLFSKPLNSLQTVKSPFGIHLVKVEKRVPAGYLSVDEVKKLVVSEIKAQREQALFMSWLDSQIRSSKVLKNKALIDGMKVETVDEK